MPDWLWSASESRGRALALSPLLPAEALYRLGARIHRAAYRSGWMRRVRLDARVVSVGNLAVGGSGKTPVTAWLARELRDRGRRVAILSRGVGGRRIAELNVVSDGDRVLLGPRDVGDEPVWLARAARGVPVFAGRNRVALGLRALSVFGTELLLVDDGFQHHRLCRDDDLVCLDARLGLGNGHVLPRGPLRESPSVLDSADALLVTRARKPGGDLPGEALLPRGIPRFWLEVRPRSLRALVSGETRSLEWLAGRPIGVLAALARPDRLRVDLETLGARVERVRAFPDHYLYTRADLESLDTTRTWVTTGKDAVKIPPDWVGKRQVLVLEEDVRTLGAGQGLIEWLLARVDGPGRRV